MQEKLESETNEYRKRYEEAKAAYADVSSLLRKLHSPAAVLIGVVF